MTRELPSIPEPIDEVVTVPVHTHVEYVTSTQIITAIGESFQGGVTLGGVVTFVTNFPDIPVVTAVPEVL